MTGCACSNHKYFLNLKKIFVVTTRKKVKLTIKTNKNLCEILERTFIRMHDEFLRENENSVFDWFCEDEEQEIVKYTLSLENLPQDDVQYVIQTLEILERNFNG